MRVSASQNAQILDFLENSDPWEACPAVNRTLQILGFEDRYNFHNHSDLTIEIYKEK